MKFTRNSYHVIELGWKDRVRLRQALRKDGPMEFWAASLLDALDQWAFTDNKLPLIIYRVWEQEFLDFLEFVLGKTGGYGADAKDLFRELKTGLLQSITEAAPPDGKPEEVQALDWQQTGPRAWTVEGLGTIQLYHLHALPVFHPHASGKKDVTINLPVLRAIMQKMLKHGGASHTGISSQT